MRIYLAGGFPIMQQKGREEELNSKFKEYKRLYSFHFLELLHKSEILKISKNENILSDNPEGCTPATGIG